MHVNDLLKIAVDNGASDLHLKVGTFPMMRVRGTLLPVTEEKRLDHEDVVAMSAAIMSTQQRQKFKETQEVDLAYSVAGLGRFRCNIFQQRGTVGLVLRVIPMQIRTVDELGLPHVLKKIAEEERGLVLVTGTTGSGKSTTLAALIDFINKSRAAHIMTVFPPHQQKQIRLQLASVLKAVISQRLLPRTDGQGRAPAVEVMISTPFIRDCIVDKEKTHLIHGAIAAGTSQYGMQTFDQSIFGLYSQGLVAYEEALRWASNVDEFKLKVQGIQTTTDASREQMARQVTGAASATPEVTRFGR